MHKPNKAINLPATANDAEKALIGSIMLAPEMVDAVATEVCGHDFFDIDLGKMFDGLVLLHQAAKKINDPILLQAEFAAMGLPVEVRNLHFLIEMLRLVPSALNATYYAAEIRRASLVREMHATGLELAERATAADATPDALAAWADARLQNAGSRQASSVRRIDAIAADVLAGMDPAAHRSPPIMTGLHSVDDATGGFSPGELIVLAARPGVGKSALALQIAMHNANANRSALLVSLEMSAVELATRVLCGLGNVDSRSVRERASSATQRERLAHAAERVGDAPVFVWSPAMATLSRIRAVARQHAAANPLRLLIVDYLQLVIAEPDQRRVERYEHVTAVSAGLKFLAKELGVPVLCLAQLNRQADGAEPKLSHLRESGAIEQDADVVLLLHPTRAASGERPGVTDLIVAKHRHGETCKLALTWLPAKTRFDDSDSHEFD